MLTLRQTFIFSVIALFLVFCAFGQILTFPMTDVDTWPLLLTSQIHSVRDIASFFVEELMKGRMINARYFRPVLNLSYALDLKIWGFDPFGFHLTSLLLHWLTGVGVFVLARQLFSKTTERWRMTLACISACLFLLHPMNVEVVPAIARRAELLTGFFLVLSLNLFLFSARYKNAYALSLFLFLCGLFCKESMIIFPCVVFLASFFLFYPNSTTTLLQRTLWSTAKSLPFAAVLGIYFFMRIWVLGSIGGYTGQTNHLQKFLENAAGHPLGLLIPGLHPFWPAAADFFLQHPPLKIALLGILGLTLALFLLMLGFHPRPNKNQDNGIATASPLGAQRGFLLGFLGLHILLLCTFGFNFRYLYLEIIPGSLLLGLALVQVPVLFRNLSALPSTYLKVRRFLVLSGVIFVGLNTFLGSTLFNRSPLQFWKKDAQLGQHLYEQLAQQIEESKIPPSRIFLVNFPYQEIAHPWAKFLTVPLSIITLEHAAQAFLDIHVKNHPTQVVGLSYLYLYRSEDAQETPAVMAKISPQSTRLLNVEVESGGYPIGLPWHDFFGPRHRGWLYHTQVNPLDKQFLEITLTPEGLQTETPLFAFFDGSPTLKFFDNPIDQGSLARLKN